MWTSLALGVLFTQEPVYKFYSTVFGTTVVKPGGLTGLVYAIEPGTGRLPVFDRMRPISKVYTTALDIPLQEFDKGFPGVPERFEWFASITPKISGFRSPAGTTLRSNPTTARPCFSTIGWSSTTMESTPYKKRKAARI